MKDKMKKGVMPKESYEYKLDNMDTANMKYTNMDGGKELKKREDALARYVDKNLAKQH